jgi:hypothetical protein
VGVGDVLPLHPALLLPYANVVKTLAGADELHGWLLPHGMVQTFTLNFWLVNSSSAKKKALVARCFVQFGIVPDLNLEKPVRLLCSWSERRPAGDTFSQVTPSPAAVPLTKHCVFAFLVVGLPNLFSGHDSS